jgi:hypothetical protein
MSHPGNSGALPLVYWVTWRVLTGPEFSSDVQALVVGQVMGTALGASVQYWLGSSSGSARKTEMSEAAKGSPQ